MRGSRRAKAGGADPPMSGRMAETAPRPKPSGPPKKLERASAFGGPWRLPGPQRTGWWVGEAGSGPGVGAKRSLYSPRR